MTEERCDVAVRLRAEEDDTVTTLELEGVPSSALSSALNERLRREGFSPDDTTIVRVEFAPTDPAVPPPTPLEEWRHGTLADGWNGLLGPPWEAACVGCVRRRAGSGPAEHDLYVFTPRWARVADLNRTLTCQHPAVKPAGSDAFRLSGWAVLVLDAVALLLEFDDRLFRGVPKHPEWRSVVVCDATAIPRVPSLRFVGR